jgi:hypothetical protein
VALTAEFGSTASNVPELMPCPFMTGSELDNHLMCQDGSMCNVVTDGWGCCNDKGTREKCPKNFPVMCRKERACAAGMDYCCEATISDCASFNGTRPCLDSTTQSLAVSVNMDFDRSLLMVSPNEILRLDQLPGCTQRVTIRAVDDMRVSPGYVKINHNVQATSVNTGETGTVSVLDGSLREDSVMSVMVYDNDEPQLIVEERSGRGGTHLAECSGEAEIYTLRLSKMPYTAVTIDVESRMTQTQMSQSKARTEPAHQLHVDPAQLVFVKDNWREPQRVVVRAICDGQTEGGSLKYFAEYPSRLDEIQGDIFVGAGESPGSQSLTSATSGKSTEADPVMLDGEANPFDPKAAKYILADSEVYETSSTNVLVLNDTGTRTSRSASIGLQTGPGDDPDSLVFVGVVGPKIREYWYTAQCDAYDDVWNGYGCSAYWSAKCGEYAENSDCEQFMALEPTQSECQLAVDGKSCKRSCCHRAKEMSWHAGGGYGGEIKAISFEQHKLALGNGNDEVFMGNSWWMSDKKPPQVCGGYVEVDMGPGNDIATVHESLGGLYVSAGHGDDTINLNPAVYLPSSVAACGVGAAASCEDFIDNVLSQGLKLLHGPMIVDGGAGPNNILNINNYFVRTTIAGGDADDDAAADTAVNGRRRTLEISGKDFEERHLQRSAHRQLYDLPELEALRNIFGLTLGVSGSVDAPNYRNDFSMGSCYPSDETDTKETGTALQGFVPSLTTKKFAKRSWFEPGCPKQEFELSNRNDKCQSWTTQNNWGTIMEYITISLQGLEDSTFSMWHRDKSEGGFSFTMQTPTHVIEQKLQNLWFGRDTYKCGRYHRSKCAQSFQVQRPSEGAQVQEGNELGGMKRTTLLIQLLGELNGGSGEAQDIYEGLDVRYVPPEPAVPPAQPVLSAGPEVEVVPDGSCAPAPAPEVSQCNECTLLPDETWECSSCQRADSSDSAVFEPSPTKAICTGCLQSATTFICDSCDDGERADDEAHIIQVRMPLVGFAPSDLARRLVQRSLRVAFMIAFGIIEEGVDMLLPTSLPQIDPVLPDGALWRCGSCVCHMCSEVGMDADAAVDYLQATEISELSHVARTYGGTDLTAFEKDVVRKIQSGDSTVSDDKLRKIWNGGFNSFSPAHADSSTLYCKSYNLEVDGGEGFAKVQKTKGTQGVWYYGVNLQKSKLQFDGFPPTAPPTPFPTGFPTAPTRSPTQFPTRFPTKKKIVLPPTKDTSLFGRITRLEYDFYGYNTTGSLLTRLNSIEKTVFGTAQQGLLWARVEALETTFSERIGALEEAIYGGMAHTGPLLDRLEALENFQDGQFKAGSMHARVNSLMESTYGTDEEVLETRIALLEEELYAEEKSGDLEARVSSMELSMLGQNQTGVLSTRVATLEGTFSSRIAFLEKRIFGADQLGGLESRLEGLEIHVFTEIQPGALFDRMIELEMSTATQATLAAGSNSLDTEFMEDFSARLAALEIKAYNLEKGGPVEGRLADLEMEMLGATSTSDGDHLLQRLQSLEAKAAADSRRRLQDQEAYSLVVALRVPDISAKEGLEDKLNNRGAWQEFQSVLGRELSKFRETDLMIAATDGDFLADLYDTFKKAPTFGSGGGFDDDIESVANNDNNNPSFGSSGPSSSEAATDSKERRLYIIVIAVLAFLLVLIIVQNACSRHQDRSKASRNKVQPKEAPANPTLSGPAASADKPQHSGMYTVLGCLVLLVVIVVVVVVFVEF